MRDRLVDYYDNGQKKWERHWKAQELDGPGETELGTTSKKKRKKKKVSKNKGKKRLKLSKASGVDGFGPRKRNPRKPGNS